MEQPMDRKKYQLRAVATNFETREDGEGPIIEGYFAVYNSDYEIAPGMSESIAPGAFSQSLNGDIRCLTNHDTTLVNGRTTAGTFELRDDETGLWGRCRINPNDTDAMNAWHRVQRKDVTQCSIGFEIVREETESRPDGSIHWRIVEAILYECSICTFPAYEATSVSARCAQRDALEKRRLDEWKNRMKGALKNGTQSPDAQEKD